MRIMPNIGRFRCSRQCHAQTLAATPVTHPRLSYPLAAALALAGCANAMPGASPTPVKAPPPDTSGTFGQSGGYVLSDAERALDCKKITGRMQLRILQIRGSADRPTTSAAARTTQALVKPIFGGSGYGIDPKRQSANDRAVLDAYNAELGRKGCPMFDLESELASTDSKHTPRPLMPK